MPRSKSLKPKYCRHKASNRAFVVLDGRFIYLGRYGTQDSHDLYDRLIGEWIARGRQTPLKATDQPNGPSAPTSVTISSLISVYWEHAKSYYVRADGTPTHEIKTLRYALRPLRRLYGPTPAAEFGPLKLKAVRQEMITPSAPLADGATVRRGWSRRYINQQISRIKSMFRWATENEMIPPSVHHGLLAVRGLKKGRSDARETEPVKPVENDLVGPVLACVSRHVAAMIQLQRLTGMRSGELVILRACDLQTDGPVWTYHPSQHKTQHHGHQRVIHFGPQAQAILQPFLRSDPQAFLFPPAEAERERLEALHRGRKTPLSQGNVPGSNRRKKPKRVPGERYDVGSYHRAITRGCDHAFPPPPPLVQAVGETREKWRRRLTDAQKEELKRWRKAHCWHPHRLRHTAATELRRRFGIEAARVILGHRSAAITEVYAEADVRKAAEVMAQVG